MQPTDSWEISHIFSLRNMYALHFNLNLPRTFQLAHEHMSQPVSMAVCSAVQCIDLNLESLILVVCLKYNVPAPWAS